MDKIQLDEKQKILSDHFGFNFWYVADLYDRYKRDRTSVSDYWQQYFSEIDSETPPASQNKPAAPPAAQPESNSPEINPPKSIPQHIPELSDSDEARQITGAGARIIDNMTASLSVPTATSQRTISVRLLEENRRIINRYQSKSGGSKVSFTHLIAFAIVKAIEEYPALNNSFASENGTPYLIAHGRINIGIAIDIEKKDGTRSLIVPNIKDAGRMNFSTFLNLYNDIVARSRKGGIEPDDFRGTTISLTNPGTVGTVSSIPRLMSGQGAIIATGVIDYPSQYQAMNEETIAALGIGKVMNITCTYDHRVIQGAESGLFLKKVNELLLGEEDFFLNIFTDLRIPQRPAVYKEDTSYKPSVSQPDTNVAKQARILQLINIYRVRGHLIANLNPLGSNSTFHAELDPSTYGFSIWDYDRHFITGGLGGKENGTLREILDILHQTYCDKIGIEYMHIQHPEEKAWLQSKMEPVRNTPAFSKEEKIRIMWKLVAASNFEHYLHNKYVGHKRFSLEGSETLIPMLDYIVNLASADGVDELFFGMSHRGRLNVLANIIGKSYEKIFAEFEGNIDPESVQGSGDVKYHLGASGELETLSGRKMKIAVASNPSHLEWVNPVAEGIVRAKQQRANDTERTKIIPVLLHGDDAFAGQGVVAETLNLSQLKGYRTGGTIHIIVNNQIGFTTDPAEARSSIYATDVAKMVQAPIFHVNGDDPEASLWTAKLAFEYRQKFNKDVVIDLFGFRRHGHNEGDDPAYTQPILYRKIREHPSVTALYQQKLITEGIITQIEASEMDTEVNNCLNMSFDEAKDKKLEFFSELPLALSENELRRLYSNYSRQVTQDILNPVIDAVTKLPRDFNINPKLKKILDKRRELLQNKDQLIDWAYAEALAFGTLLQQGVPVRLSGQDSARGTFSQRHLILTDINTGSEIILHNHISEKQALLEPLDSLLSEAAVLGFEFGFSVADPQELVIWEAQFGDFANGAQVIIDNFLSTAYSKWKVPNKVVLLLPHGFEGQGPEHSSARIERFLSLCAEDNMTVCNPSTPAQYFHLLRLQADPSVNRPLIIMTPKSLLRLPEARSAFNELIDQQFMPVMDDNLIRGNNKIERLIFVSGKLFYELDKYRSNNNAENAAVIRLEQLYPFPSDEIKRVLNKYSGAKKIIWTQEEPKNMGAWSFLSWKFKELLNGGMKLNYSGRPESASPASGSLKIHQKEQNDLITEAFTM